MFSSRLGFRRRRCCQNRRSSARPGSILSRAVVADGFDRTTFHCLFAEGFLFWTFGLFVNVGMAAVVVPFEIGRRGLAAEVAVDALLIDIKGSRRILRVFVCRVRHV